MPHPEKSKRGSVATALVIGMAVLLLMLPFFLGGQQKLYDWLLVRRTHQYLQQVLPIASTGLDPVSLAAGEPKIRTVTTRPLVTDYFNAHCPDMLSNRLSLQRVRFITKRITPDPDHWMGEKQPLTRPIVVIEASLTLSDGKKIQIAQAIEIFLD